VLPDGRVLLRWGAPRRIGAIYDPTTDVWSETSDKPADIPFDVSTVLLDGRVLAVGFSGAAAVVDVRQRVPVSYLYDPVSDLWSPTAVPTMRALGNMTRLADGRVLAVARHPRQATTESAEVYDPSAGAWTATGVVEVAGPASLVALPDGRALLWDRPATPGGTGRLAVYDPSSGQWSGVAMIRLDQVYSTMAVLADGRVLVSYGRQTEVLDIGTGRWMGGAALTDDRSGRAATLLPSGEVLVTGGLPTSGARVALRSAERSAP
jgi:hypothetical protein